MTAEEPIVADSGRWDVIVIGTGMGGGTVGLSLARQGLKVLFLEKGPDEPAKEHALTEGPSDPQGRLQVGRWPGRISMSVDGRPDTSFARMGCSVGGTSRVYGAALERYEPWDFESVPGLPHPTGGWPLTYADMAPYYAEAETLYRVRGSRDPLGEKDSPELPRLPPMAPADAQLMRDLAKAGLSPYRMHVGIAYKPDCIECLGYGCARECKSEAGVLAVRPAVREHGAELRTGCDVVRLEADSQRVTGVIYRRDGALRRVTGEIVILAAGGYRSPLVLLQSASDLHPVGLANSSGMVGRNMMFHCADWIALWPSRKASPAGPRKTIATRHFMALDGVRGGLLHSTGLSAGYGNILMFLYEWFDRSRLRWLRPLRPFLRIPAKIAEKLFGNATILSINVEDLPYPENRLEPDPEDPDSGIIHYRIHDELRERMRVTRAAIAKGLSGIRHFWLHSDLRLNLGHPCGGCRFGDDPATSVLDPDCRAHDLDNLYVVDSSFMPTSGGSNPSLTIAANALRVGDVIAARLRSEMEVAAE